MVLLASSTFFFSFPQSTAVAQQSRNETLTIVTYYPSPTGVYSTLRLSPTNQPTTGSDHYKGMLYYNVTDDKIRYYAGVGKGWLELGGGGGGYWELGANNSINNTNPGKVVIDGVLDWNGELFEIHGDTRIASHPVPGTCTLLYLEREGSDTGTGLVFVSDVQGTAWNDYFIGTREGSPSLLSIGRTYPPAPGNNVYYLTVADDKVGIGTETPQQRLEVNGSLRLTPTTAPATPAPLARWEGSMYYNSSRRTPMYRDNSTWNSFISEYGNITVPAGQSVQRVNFRKTYASPPFVIATPVGTTEDMVLVRSYNLTSTYVDFDMDVITGSGAHNGTSIFNQEIDYIVIPR